MNRRLTAALALAVLAGLVALGMPAFSGATFTSTTRNTATVSAAADWTAPTVSVQAVGSPVKDTVTVGATAADGETGIANVVIQYIAPNASSWTTLCTDTSAPYSCSWNTKLSADGSYEVRALATDNAGYSTTSATVSTVVANNVLVVLTSPGDVVKGSVPLSAAVYNPGIAVYTVTMQYAVAGSGTWRTACTALLAPYTCTWSTSALSNVEYDLRAVATAGATTYTSAVVPDVLVDNAAPTVTMTDPGTPLRGTVTLAGTAADNESGVAQVQVQYQRSGSTTWTTACTLTLDPYSCRFDTTATAYGTYNFRAVATDQAGNITTSASITNRLIDNTVSSVSVEDPGAFLSGTVTVAATANSTAGVASVRLQRAATGTTTWTDLCTDTTSPYSCTWDTTSVADGGYDFRAIMVDGTGASTGSATVSNRRVDNNPLRGYDVQTVSGGATKGKLDAGDHLLLTYTTQVLPSSVTAGWDGTALGVTVRLRDGNLVGLGAKADTLDVLRNGSAVNLGSVNLREDYVKSNKTAQFNATMTAVTTTVNGVSATQVTIVLGALASGGNLKGGTIAGAMVWTPSALATDLTGRASSTAPVTERGTTDREF
ncbi:MAG TPA: Ig-like domain-containing protein [Nocardioidaceae bacterium]|nr:Ig-like domain-containing protein [Nocardioidaceae bacterium]